MMRQHLADNVLYSLFTMLLCSVIARTYANKVTLKPQWLSKYVRNAAARGIAASVS
jgi:hypothetical protein